MSVDAPRRSPGRPAPFAPRWSVDRPVPFPLPKPAQVRTVAELRAAVAEMLHHRNLGEISATMRVPLSTVRLVSQWPERADRTVFELFLSACGVGRDQARSWVSAWQALADRRQQEPDGAMAGATTVATVPVMAGSYGDLVRGLRALQAGASMSAADIEAKSGGRLRAQRVDAILDGVQPATGEEFVLLLRACGLRDEVDEWIVAWQRLDGATMGRPAASVHRLPPVTSAGAGPLLAGALLLVVIVLILVLA